MSDAEIKTFYENFANQIQQMLETKNDIGEMSLPDYYRFFDRFHEQNPSPMCRLIYENFVFYQEKTIMKSLPFQDLVNRYIDEIYPITQKYPTDQNYKDFLSKYTLMAAERIMIH